MGSIQTNSYYVPVRSTELDERGKGEEMSAIEMLFIGFNIGICVIMCLVAFFLRPSKKELFKKKK